MKFGLFILFFLPFLWLIQNQNVATHALNIDVEGVVFADSTKLNQIHL